MKLCYATVNFDKQCVGTRLSSLWQVNVRCRCLDNITIHRAHCARDAHVKHERNERASASACMGSSVPNGGLLSQRIPAWEVYALVIFPFKNAVSFTVAAAGHQDRQVISKLVRLLAAKSKSLKMRPVSREVQNHLVTHHQWPRNLYSRDGKFRPTFKSGAEKRVFSIPPDVPKVHQSAQNCTYIFKKFPGGNIPNPQNREAPAPPRLPPPSATAHHPTFSQLLQPLVSGYTKITVHMR